jgi:hypothetical protein
MSEFATQPRKTPLAGHWTGKVATSRWCRACERLHRTRRHADGEEPCPTAPCWGCEHERQRHGTDGTGPCAHDARCRCAGFLEPERGVTPHEPAIRLTRLGPSTANPFNPATR